MRATWPATALVTATMAVAPGVCAQRAPAATVDPAAGWHAPALAEVLSYAQAQKSTGFLIVQNGRIVAEATWPLGADAAAFEHNFVHGTAADGALLEDVASQQKSFIAILVGVAIDKGMLDISKPVAAYAGAGWSKASSEQEAAIAVRNLLQMNSGLREDLTFDAAPDTRFFYNTPAYAVLKKVLEGASKRPLDALTRDWLTGPLGMSDTSWMKRPDSMADVGNPTGLVTTPRDIAKMGQLVLAEGVAPDGTRVISRAQLDAMFERTVTNPSYGRLWWLNGGAWSVAATRAARRTEGQLIAAAPADLVAALGAQDRKLYVVPGRGLIVVRTGRAAPDRDFDQQLWVRLMKAMPDDRRAP
jgi:CubicO group peptidase (beta-lactamase class C family)